MKATITSCEANLAHGYTTLQKHGVHATTDGKSLFARFLIRSILFVTKKEHKQNEEESHDAKLIAKRKWDLEEDQFYHLKGDLKHCQFKSTTDTVANFEHVPLFPPRDGQPWKLEVTLDQLKTIKKATSEPPQLLVSQAMQELLPESLDPFQQEKLKAEATIALQKVYHE
eukprot:s6107_g2.t1